LQLKRGDRVFLEGELGAGKTTFARAMLEALGIDQPAEGSPTFPIAHEYQSPRGEVIHVDFYRLKREAELEEAGITAYFWEREAIVLSEWISLFPSFRDAVLKTRVGRVFRVTLSRIPNRELERDVSVYSLT
jgi:tRNA threonylcarbamoyl adenosine modification protein YjeE